MSFAQNYTSFYGLHSTKWEAPWCNLDVEYMQLQEIGLDTSINGVQYKKVGTWQPGFGLSYDLSGISSNGYVRENTNSGKIWFAGTIETFSSFDTVEYLVMDLSLEVNDTFLIHENIGQVVTSIIDSVYYVSGLKHVQTDYTFWSNEQPLTFIEGVGTNYGITYMHDSYNMCHCLVSLIRDDNEVYSNAACFPAVAENTEITKEQELSVYPNPARTHITINSKPGNQYEIYSILGERVLNGTMHSSSMQIDISNLVSNVYFIRVNNKSFKLIKTD